MLTALLAASLAWVALCSGAHAEPPPPDTRELAARAEALARVGALGDDVARPLALARRALERARRARLAERAEAAAHSERIAEAAVALAEARLRRARERALLDAAEARRRTAREELGLARDALERARARARGLGEDGGG